MKVGFLPLARQTFDVPFAASTASEALASLRRSTDAAVIGDDALAMDTEAVASKAKTIANEGPSATVILQATFADSTLVREAAEALDCPLILWAVPEDRTGGRLRLNSLCGINLAAYVLAREGIDYRWLYRSPDEPSTQSELNRAISSGPDDWASPVAAAPPEAATDPPTLTGKTVGLVGDRPEGFEPCDFEPEELMSRFGVKVDRVELADLFAAGEESDADSVHALRTRLSDAMAGLTEVDQHSLDRSLRIYLGLAGLADERHWQGVATRCWPECFTEFGGAACAGNSILTSEGIPGCCEADVYGDVTALLLQELADLPPFVADLVDVDRESNSAVFWHCGLAAQELAPDGMKPRATVHSNRRKPLLNEFALRPGRVTITRLSQSRGEQRMLLATGEMLDDPLPFSGTSGVARLDADVDVALDTIMAHGLEHHYGIAYGDHREKLKAYAASVGIQVIEL
jgi:L-fucose isomerase-like protein